MKKVIVLFAAAAMFAFVGCNKEENTTYVADQDGMVTLRMSGENWQNTAKQTYMNRYTRIAFDAGDQAYINGVLAAVNPCNAEGATTNADETPITRSFYGQMLVNANALTGDDYVIYPASMFTAGTAADMSDYTVTMPAMPVFLVENANTTLGASHPVWPMASKLSGNNFVMKNAVALLTPSVKYGDPFINALATMANSPIANEGVDVDNSINVPELYITGIQYVSTDQPLSGEGHLTNMATEPYLVMDGTADADYTLTVNIDPDNAPQVPNSGNTEVLLGNITVAPFAAGKHLQMIVNFTLYFPNSDHAYDFIYTGATVEMTETPNNNSILRSMRTTTCVNLYSAGSINKVALVED